MHDFFETIEKNTNKTEGSPFAVQKRSWGLSVALGENVNLNMMTGEPSAHFHRHRTEEYILYSGQMTVFRGPNIEGNLEATIAGMEAVRLNPGDKIVISSNTVHIPVRTSDDQVVFFDVYSGTFEEGDIERVYDMTGRDAELAQKWAELGYEKELSIKDLIPRVRAKLNK